MQHPPFCPHLPCKLHTRQPSGKSWYVRNGTYLSRCKGRIQRYRCKACGAGFSSQSFHIDYYAKRIVDYHDLLDKLKSCSSTRDMARDFKVSTATVQNKVFRLARQAISLHAELTSALRVSEDLVADGFESFCVSQYYPNNIHLLAGRHSQFLYHLNYVTIRRKGRMRAEQKRKRTALERLYSAPYRGIELSFKELLDRLLDLSKGRLTLFSDEKRDYGLALKGIGGICHRTISSRRERTYANPLFAVNYLDRQIRKDLKEHVRETVCFSRNVCNSMERLVLYSLYHNYLKAYRAKLRKGEYVSHAEKAGIDGDLVRKGLKTLFTRRRFLSHTPIRGFMRYLWKRQLFTPLKDKVEYVPKYALA